MDLSGGSPTLLPMPLMPPISPTPDDDFDFDILLQGDDGGFAATAQSVSTGTTCPDTTTLSSDASSDQSRTLSSLKSASSSSSATLDIAPRTRTFVPAQSQAQAQKQRLERKGHTKSRRGCFNCKRRRIKCQETHPACGHCVKSGLKCEYPTLPRIIHQPHHQIPLFSLQDMRFFQHFLLQCYPHHPIGNENIWTHEVPYLSQSHDYLMHAILGVAACDLAARDPTLLPQAVHHRMKAIKAVKRCLADVSARSGGDASGSGSASAAATTSSAEEANAMIATCFALTFQSVTFADGMAEYMAFLRGIIIVAIQMYFRGIRPMFNNLLGEESNAVLGPFMADLPVVRRDWVDDAVTAVAALAPLCKDEVEVEYQHLLTEMVQLLYTSSWDAYKALQKHYGWWLMLPHDKFQRVVDGDNQVMVLLAAHWISIKQIMAHITEREYSVRQKKPPPRPEGDGCGGEEEGTVRWLRHLNRCVDADHRRYNAWPSWVMARLDEDLGFFGRGSISRQNG